MLINCWMDETCRRSFTIRSLFTNDHLSVMCKVPVMLSKVNDMDKKWLLGIYHKEVQTCPVLNWGYVWDCFCTYCRYKAECSQGTKYFKYKDYHWQSQPFNVCSEGCQQDFLNSRCPLWHSLDSNYTSTACHQELKLRAFFFFLSLTLSITHKCIMSNITEWQTLKATWAWCDSW